MVLNGMYSKIKSHYMAAQEVRHPGCFLAEKLISCRNMHFVYVSDPDGQPKNFACYVPQPDYSSRAKCSLPAT